MIDYRRDIDGLRAIAVSAVVLFHAGITVLRGGFVGVDIFFVISGYLITSIIIKDVAAGRFSFIDFYDRRTRRILPALFTVLLSSMPFAILLLTPDDLVDYAKSFIAVPLFASNFYFWKSSGYFTASSEFFPLLHTWSLAVEEQYYIFFPILISLFWKKGPRFVIGTVTAFAVMSFALAQWAAYSKPDAAFYLLPTRFWELAAGALCAFYNVSRASVTRDTVAVRSAGYLGALAIAASVLIYDSTTPFPSAYTILPVAGTILLLLWPSPKSLVTRLLSCRPLVFIGLISYSLYLWHQPVIVFYKYAKGTELATQDTIAIVAAVAALSALSFWLIERPFRNRNIISRKTVFLASGFLTFFCISIGGLIVAMDGIPSRMSSRQLEALSWSHYPYEQEYRMSTCFLNRQEPPSQFAQECSGGKNPRYEIWGDSHAAALAAGLRKTFGNVGQYTASGCGPAPHLSIYPDPAHCVSMYQAILTLTQENAPQTIILHANWTLYSEQALDLELTGTINALRRFRPQQKIVIVGSVPQWSPSLPRVIARLNVPLDAEVKLRASNISELSKVDARLRVLSKNAGVTFVSVLDSLCRFEECTATVESGGKWAPMAWDYGHLTLAGSETVVRLIAKEL